VLTDLGVRDTDGLPPNLTGCAKGTWNERMIIEPTCALLTGVCHTKKFFHRGTNHLFAHCASLAALFNVVTALLSNCFLKTNASARWLIFRSNLLAPLVTTSTSC
jgi:hypothetical protein